MLRLVLLIFTLFCCSFYCSSKINSPDPYSWFWADSFITFNGNVKNARLIVFFCL
jgi:hypothetical protein